MREPFEDVPNLGVVMTPAGGGGLFSGTQLAASSVAAHVRVVGAEPEGADDSYRSLRAGHTKPAENPVTIADGLRISLGHLTFPIIQRRVSDIVTVCEQSIKDAMRLIVERMKSGVTPSVGVLLGVLPGK
jgi:threonine dehydratase